MNNKRKFIGLIDRKGLADIGMSGLTFMTNEIVKGAVYEEHWNTGEWSTKREPSGYFIDDNGIWHKINSTNFKEKFEEIVD